MDGYAALAKRRQSTVIGAAPTANRADRDSALTVILSIAGGVIAGRYCSRAWPAHPVWGFILGYSFIGSPIGGALGETLS